MVLFGAMVLHVVIVQLKIPVDNSNQAGRKQRARNNKHKRNKLADENGKILCCKYLYRKYNKYIHKNQVKLHT